jgi:hypothetical protein
MGETFGSWGPGETGPGGLGGTPGQPGKVTLWDAVRVIPVVIATVCYILAVASYCSAGGNVLEDLGLMQDNFG